MSGLIGDSIFMIDLSFDFSFSEEMHGFYFTSSSGWWSEWRISSSETPSRFKPPSSYLSADSCVFLLGSVLIN